MQAAIKSQFPIFRTHPRLVYLDSAATALKPQVMLAAMTKYYTAYSANIHRGLYPLAVEADAAYEAARETLARFIHATTPAEIIFVAGTTAGLNHLASSIGKSRLKRGDEVMVTEAEHHSNLVPWQMVCQQVGAKLTTQVSPKTKVLAVCHVSNVLGAINPIPQLVASAKRVSPDCLVIVDAAQSVPHLPVDVGNLGCDALVFSGHKLYGPTGIGVVWARAKLLETLPPFMGGGGMVYRATLTTTQPKRPPDKFEAGTPHIAGVIGLAAVVDWLMREVGMAAVRDHELQLTAYALGRLAEIGGVEIYGPNRAQDRGGLISFNLPQVPAHDVAQVLADRQVCVRAGHHCAMPLHARLGVAGSVRASFGVYTTKADIDRLIAALVMAKKKFAG